MAKGRLPESLQDYLARFKMPKAPPFTASRRRLQKSFQDYLARLKMPAMPSFPTRRGLLATCKYPKTPSFSNYRSRFDNDPTEKNHSRRDDAATLKEVDRYLAENFASLYQDESAAEEERYGKDDILCESAAASPETPSGLRSTRRFVAPPPGDVNSLAEESLPGSASSSLVHSGPCESSSSSAPDDDNEARLPEDTLAVVTYSLDPYEDFRRSMQKVVASRRARGAAPPDWDFFEELLLSYLSFNEKRMHKYILGAFVDLIAGFRPSFGREDVPIVAEARKKKVSWTENIYDSEK